MPPSTLVHANFNIQVHTRPNFTAPSVVVIPFETEISPVGISENGRWLYVLYEDKTGWAWAPLFDLTQEQRALIPIHPVPARNS